MASSNTSSLPPSIGSADWLQHPAAQAVFNALAVDGGEVRAVGGAVRNELMGLPVRDVDLATTVLPQDVMRLAKQAGLQCIPTGIDHGTVTVVSDGIPFEVTTLRRDVETFGRKARVNFSTDWREDAMRRDFTMNALYADAGGNVHDPLGGYGDLTQRRVRFIGDARARIREDYLRILRFFRFMAEYGDPYSPDAEGMAATGAEREGLTTLSGERIRAELLKLLAAPGAVPALAAMAQNDLIAPLIGTAGDVDAVAHLAAIEHAQRLKPDPILRLAALSGAVPPDELQRKLRLSSAETTHLTNAARCTDAAFDPTADQSAVRAFIYRHGPQAYQDGALLAWARSGAAANDATRSAHLDDAREWQAPQLPLRGADVLKRGIEPGPEVGSIVTAFENWWIAAGFPDDAGMLDSKLDALIAASRSRNAAGKS
ncbi:CCA tRNA nucleotidyltransferase [Hyphomicrobium sulfonivorans]|uniref:CCA tRNA nucleotidyltransferase n=1 Tax=Hyphomicrobium sulfonivorans TaxID=121290 RepID=UPI00156EBFBA|nr:CCA tRNA nucleotidyltransferase [Hyphomicrobium sulfonivorans]MBI1649677.1 CCA tRNA nucleotidyltransferase [Hyphomicrobium sulfonivorans]NSL71591.1 CCA tRNA nucleotidyltransferase [Hyphomicrobium sulfonivorans]